MVAVLGAYFFSHRKQQLADIEPPVGREPPSSADA